MESSKASSDETVVWVASSPSGPTTSSWMSACISRIRAAAASGSPSPCIAS